MRFAMNESRQMVCRRCVEAGADAGAARPFVRPGARAVFAPDRVCDVRHLEIDVTLDFQRRRVAGVCTLDLVAINDGPTRLRLDAIEMRIHAVELAGGAEVPFSYDGHGLTVELGERKQGEELELSVRYECEPRRGMYFIHADEAYPKRPLQAWTQGQDEE